MAMKTRDEYRKEFETAISVMVSKFRTEFGPFESKSDWPDWLKKHRKGLDEEVRQRFDAQMEELRRVFPSLLVQTAADFDARLWKKSVLDHELQGREEYTGVWEQDDTFTPLSQEAKALLHDADEADNEEETNNLQQAIVREMEALSQLNELGTVSPKDDVVHNRLFDRLVALYGPDLKDVEPDSPQEHMVAMFLGMVEDDPEVFNSAVERAVAANLEPDVDQLFQNLLQLDRADFMRLMLEVGQARLSKRDISTPM